VNAAVEKTFKERAWAGVVSLRGKRLRQFDVMSDARFLAVLIRATRVVHSRGENTNSRAAPGYVTAVGISA
jgi:hypothetical protein